MAGSGRPCVACIFCEIMAGRVPSHKVAESDLSVVFLDAFPSARGHCLAVPKKHFERAQDMPPESAADLAELAFRTVSRMEERLECDTLVAMHNGRGAGQEVPHVHMHLLPRRPGDGADAATALFPDRRKLDPAEAAGLLELLGG